MKRSDSIKEISIALCKLGADLGNAKKNSVNPHFKNRYADLASILNYVKPILAAHELAVVQSSRPGENNSLIVETLLTHVSGDWIETEIELPAEVRNKYDSQTVGSAFTYGRRYGLSAALNISSEEDTDGNQTEKETKKRGNYQEILKHLKLTKNTEELKKLRNDLSVYSWTGDETIRLKSDLIQQSESFEDNSDLVGSADKIADAFKGGVE